MIQPPAQQTIALARQHYEAGNYEEAIQLCRQIAAPLSVEANILLGQAQLQLGRNAEAESPLREAIAARPDSPDVLSDLATSLKYQRKLAEAIGLYRRAIALSPEYALAHFNLGLALLLDGQLPEGFAEMEWRWRVPGVQIFEQDFPQPRWDGSPLNGRTILVREEQGYGDTIQFSRYIEWIRDRSGGRVIMGCRPELLKLLRPLRGVAHFLTHGSPLVPFDFHTTVMSLPRIFGTTLNTIPAQVPYLEADAKLVAQWADRLVNGTSHRRVGIVWAGADKSPIDMMRSIALELLRPLLEVQSCQFYSLQKRAEEAVVGDTGVSPVLGAVRTGETSVSRNAPSLIQSPPFLPLTDWADTAAAIANMDLVISVDTAVAHLAGAMGKPVWVILPHVGDWRWMLHASTTPWYPTMRLFRQPMAGDWQSPIRQVVEELERWCK